MKLQMKTTTISKMKLQMKTTTIINKIHCGISDWYTQLKIYNARYNKNILY